MIALCNDCSAANLVLLLVRTHTPSTSSSPLRVPFRLGSFAVAVLASCLIFWFNPNFLKERSSEFGGSLTVAYLATAWVHWYVVDTKLGLTVARCRCWFVTALCYEKKRTTGRWGW